MAIKKLLGKDIDQSVFLIAAALALPFIVLGGFSPAILTTTSTTALHYLTKSWGWLYLISCTAFVLACLTLACSPWGKIKLGAEGEKPEFSFVSWFAMLFSAGMGIGLVFWSVAEPIYHYMSPPTGNGLSPASARLAFKIFFFHWGLHAWATYSVVGLSMAYFMFRKKYPPLISSCLRPLLGQALSQGWLGKLVNGLAIWATIMGVVTSLGMGALQINSGLASSLGIAKGPGVSSLLIIAITCLFILSAVSGVKKGIKILSLLNVAIMLLLLTFFLIYGPTDFIIRTFVQALFDYLQSLPKMSFSLHLFGNAQWTRNWTIFYWAWWIAWAPFVGAFIAKISKGRSIREFILVVMIAPPLFSYLFSTALGGTAIFLDQTAQVSLIEAVKKSVPGALFATLHALPWFSLMTLLTNLLIASFFITSADSATYVISQFSLKETATQGKIPKQLIIFWGLLLAALAIVLLYSGGLKALQTASIVGALPFILIMYLLFVALLKDILSTNKTNNFNLTNQ